MKTGLLAVIINRLFLILFLNAPLHLLAAEAPARHQVVINAVKISDQQVQQLEAAYKVRIQDGKYWYDMTPGAWGMENGPALGQIYPGLQLGGKLRADASGGGKGNFTAVFINGRELHPQDVAALQKITQVVPGRYWVDAQGYGGYEGVPAFFNLYVLAQQSTSRGGKSWYYGNSLTGTYAGSDGGCTYVMGSNWSASSGC